MHDDSKRTGGISVKKELKISGGLKLERKTIIVLFIICGSTLLLGLLTQYIFSLIVTDIFWDRWHVDFIINVLLGISCSAAISLICVWVPYISKKETQLTKLIKLAKNMYYDYEKMRRSIISLGTEKPLDNTYYGEIAVIKKAEALEKSASALFEEYCNSNIISENFENIVDSVNTVFIPMAQMTSKYVKVLLPRENITYQELFVEKKHGFMLEENLKIYEELLFSIDKIMSNKDVCSLFFECANLKISSLELIKSSTEGFIENIERHEEQIKIHTIESSLIKNLLTIQMDYMKKDNEKKENILSRFSSLENMKSSLSLDLKKKCNDGLNEILGYINENQLTLAEEKIADLERVLKS